MPAELTEWVRSRAVPLRSFDPEDEDFADVAPIAELIGDARVVGMGESTHGTREEAVMKHRLFRFLSSQHGFTVLSLERDMAEMAAFDAALASDDRIETLPLAFHPWRSEELLDLLRWMQARRKLGANLRFSGFDMQQEVGPSSLQIVREYLAAHPHPDVATADLNLIEANVSDETWGDVDPAALAAAGRVCAAFSGLTDPVGSWAARHALISEQSLRHRAASQENAEEEMEAMFQRDAFMAGHIEWLTEHFAGSRLFLWAHNFHVGRIERYMGAKLAERFGDDYVPIGFAFHSGEFRARTFEAPGGPVAAPSAVKALEPEENCVEFALHEVGLEQFFVDLRDAPRSTEQSLMRVVGERLKAQRDLSDEFEPVRLAEAFDGLIYFDKTTPLHTLEWPGE